MKFELDKTEEAAARAWQDEHVKTCPYMLEHAHEPLKGIPTLGEHWCYKFIPTGLGSAVTVGCLYCGACENVTNYNNW